MGIPHYFYVITQQHPGILKKTCPPNVDRFYLDFNGGVHPVCHRILGKYNNSASSNAGFSKAHFEERLCTESWNYFHFLTQEIKPKEVFIALDGVAPIAKIQQQRKRRYLSILRQQLLKKPAIWDTNAISPGTPFMQNLNTFFHQKVKSTYSAFSIEFHGSDEPGEGEHKIFQHMCSLKSQTQSQPNVVYGLDADLIMLSLLSHCKDIHLMREYQQKKGQQRNHSNNHNQGDEGFNYLDIDALRKGILIMLKEQYKWPVSQQAIEDVYCTEACYIIENYVVACFLLGNDFLPNINCLQLKKNGIHYILTSFKDAWDIYGSPLVVPDEENPLNVGFLSVWLELLSKIEDELVWKLNDDYMKKKAFINSDEDRVEYYPVLPENKSQLTYELLKVVQPHKWRGLYYKHLFDSERQDMSMVMHTCNEYIIGMLWTYCYYKRIQKPSDWYYPYGYAPTIRDMYNHVTSEKNMYETMIGEWKTQFPEATFIHPYTQLLSILPYQSHHLLPDKMQQMVLDEKNGIRYMYPTKYPIYTYMKSFLWECYPRLPMLDFQALTDTVTKFINKREIDRLN